MAKPIITTAISFQRRLPETLCYNTAMDVPASLSLVSTSPEQTAALGAQLGALLQVGDLILLAGDLGAGKTQFVKGIAQGLGSPDVVTSPTFVLINEYRAGPQQRGIPILHVDLYRLERAAEAAGIGLDDALAADAVVVIEWPERADALPAERVEITLAHTGATTRLLTFTAAGARARGLLAAFARGKSNACF